MSDVWWETTTDKLTKLWNITNQSKLSLKKKMNRLLSPVKLRGEAFYFMNQLGKKLRHIHRSPIKFTSFKRSNWDTSIVNNKISSSSSDDTTDKSEILKTINLIPMSPIKRRKEITNPNLNYEQSEFLNLWTYIKSDNYLNYDDYKSHQKNSSMTPILKRAPKMISDENDEEAKSCSKLSIKKRSKLTKEISSSESQEKTSNKNFKKIRRSVVNIKIQNKLLSNSPSKNDSSPKKKKKVKKGKKRGNLNLPESNNNTSQNIHKDILSGLNSILEEMEVEGHETPWNQKSVSDRHLTFIAIIKLLKSKLCRRWIYSPQSRDSVRQKGKKMFLCKHIK